MVMKNAPTKEIPYRKLGGFAASEKGYFFVGFFTI
jgi:hypothetical protein